MNDRRKLTRINCAFVGAEEHFILLQRGSKVNVDAGLITKRGRGDVHQWRSAALRPIDDEHVAGIITMHLLDSVIFVVHKAIIILSGEF